MTATYVSKQLGQTTLDIETEKAFLEECDKYLPKAAQEKRLEAALTEIVNRFNFGKGTARKLLKIHERNYKLPAKVREKKGQLRLTQEEQHRIIDIYETTGWLPTKQFKEKVLGDRTPSVATISSLLRRHSEKYKSTVSQNNSKVPEEIQNKVISLYKEGNEIKVIVTLLKGKVSRKTIEDILVAEGFDIKQGKTKEQKDLIIKAYLEYGTEKAVEVLKENITKISATGIRTVVAEAGVKRDNSDSYRKYTLDKTYFENIVDNPEEKLYFIGLIAADGSVSPDYNKLEIELKRSDKEILEKFSKALKTNRPILDTEKYDSRVDKTYPAAKLTVHSKKLLKDLEKFGIFQKKTAIFEVHDNLLKLDSDSMRHFWRGYFDGDGYLSTETTVNKNTLELAGTLNLVTSFKNKISQYLEITNLEGPYFHHSLWRVRSQNKDNTFKIIKYLYKDSQIYLKRKYTIYLDKLARYKEIE